MTLSELAIFTDDVSKMAAFYERLLGAVPIQRGEKIAIFRVGTVQLLIHETYAAKPGDVPCENHTAFFVEDVDQSASELEERGLSIEIAPRDFDWGRSAYLRDPDGHLLEIHSR